MTEKRIEVRHDYPMFLWAKNQPGVKFDGDYAVVPDYRTVTKGGSEMVLSVASHMHEYQAFCTAFAVARERAALFLECGLGKTSIALAWAELVRHRRPALIAAPLAAQYEFLAERDKFFPGYSLEILATKDVDRWLRKPTGIALVTHHAFIEPRDLSSVAAMVLDESSILKGGDGAVIARNLVKAARPVGYRLALSATPAPNDPTEYATHATWLGLLRSDAEFRARFFVRDGKDWRIKGHAIRELPRWLSRFAVWMQDPTSYDMPCDALPDHDFERECVNVGNGAVAGDDLFGDVFSLAERSHVLKDEYASDTRMRAILEHVKGKPSLVWVIRNKHGDDVERMLASSGIRVGQVAGATSEDERVRIIRAFNAGELDTIVSKASVIGHGVNLQRTQVMVFAGYNESYEAFHQAVRRAHRQGRTGTLKVVMLVAEPERRIIEALDKKAVQWKEDSRRQESSFREALAADIHAYHTGGTMLTTPEQSEREPSVETEHFTLINGDSIEAMGDMDENSIDLSVFSPPFASLFTYSSDVADMGNTSEHEDVEFDMHFAHFADALFRVMKPGRVVALHLAQIIAFRVRHGRKGVRDFRGRVINVMEDSGFHYYGEFVIPKNPQAVAIRTKSERLQFSQLRRDSLESSPALNDYVLEFRKPGKQAVRVLSDASNEEWISWASGAWTDINETEVLQHRQARADDDEKHLAPLQLEVIRRIIRLWSNPGEVVLSPFAGIGSEVYTAIKLKRYGLGVELKPEYFREAVKHCEDAVATTHHQLSLLGAI